MKEAKAIQKQIAEEEAAKPDWKLDKDTAAAGDDDDSKLPF